jgi:hypothetical protein
MPTVLRIGKYRFFFFSREDYEPLHIHVENDDNYAKFWLEPVELAKSIGYNARELNHIRKLVIENTELFKEKWFEHFGK